MKRFGIILLLVSVVLLFGVGCPCPPCKEKETVIEKPVEKIVYKDRPVKEENPTGHVKENTPAAERHEEKLDHAKAASEVLPEPIKGLVFIRVEAKEFRDQDLLHDVRYNVIAAAHNKNYTLLKEENPDRKGFALELKSTLPGPISLRETIENALIRYKERVELFTKEDEKGQILVITQKD